MRTRAAPAEPMLPLDFGQPRPRGRSPRDTREPDDLYAAIQYLRRRGVSVHRHGRQHRVDGSILDRRQVCLLAEAPQLKGLAS